MWFTTRLASCSSSALSDSAWAGRVITIAATAVAEASLANFFNILSILFWGNPREKRAYPRESSRWAGRTLSQKQMTGRCQRTVSGGGGVDDNRPLDQGGLALDLLGKAAGEIGEDRRQFVGIDSGRLVRRKAV